MSSLRILPDLEQRSPEWYAARCGLVTASVMSKLVTSRAMSAFDYHCPACGALAMTPCVSKVKKGSGEPIKTLHPERTAHAVAMADTSPRVIELATGDEVRSLTATLVAERISGHVEETFTSGDMWRGITEEPRAVERYAETRGVEVRTVGLMVRDFNGFSIGYSPDGLIGDDGLIEVKAPRAKTHLLTVLAGEVPFYNMAQLQTGLLVSGRAWIDFLPWHGGLPLWTKRITPDPAWQAAIVKAVAEFEHNAAQMVAAYEKATEGCATTERAPELEEMVI